MLALVGLLAASILLAIQSISTVEPTIWTDKADYAPEEIVFISGTGFHPHAPITVNVTRPDGHVDSSLDQGTHVVYKVTILSQTNGTCDSNGAFTATYQLDGILGNYTVTATDQTSTAITTFTDGPKIGSVTVGTQSPNPVSAGNATTYTITIDRGTGGGSSGSIDAVLNITALPPEAIAHFSPNPVNFTPTDASKISTLTITTTTSMPGGNTSFTVRASTNYNATDYATGTGALVVQAYNHPPELSAIGNQLVDEDALLSFTASATDLDLPSQTLTFSLADGVSGDIPTGASITPEGTFTWTPTEAQGPSTYTFDVVVSDGEAVDAETISVTVNEVNQAPVLASIGDKIVIEGSLLSFTATANDADLPANTLTFSLEGVVPVGASITPDGAFIWTPTAGQNGEHTFTVIVIDDGSPTLSDEEEIVVTVNPPANVPPVADAGGPYSGTVNTPISMSGSGSTDSDGTITGYRWDWTNDGTYDTTWTSSPSTSHTYTSTGSYTLKLEVRDDDDVTATDTATVTVTPLSNVPPIADAGGPYSGTVNTPISMSGSGSTDSDGTITNYTWSFGDGDTGVGATPTHTYTNDGLFSVTLTISDNLGAIASDTTTVNVTDQETTTLIADAGGPYSGYVDTPISVDASDSIASNGTITGYRWDWTNDGTFDTNWSSSPMASHTYTSSGTFTVMIEVRDSSNLTDIDTASVSVLQRSNSNAADDTATPPEANAGGPYYSITGISILFNGSASYDPDGLIILYNWSFGDGMVSDLAMPTHAYTLEGNYTVTLTVTDDQDATDVDMTFALIGKKLNHPPSVPMMSGPNYANSNTTCTFTFNASDKDGDMIRYVIHWDDDTNDTVSPTLNSSTAFTTSHSWTLGGIFTISSYATDVYNATSDLFTMKLFINVCLCEDLGYLIDKNGDEVYDVFYYETTGQETPVEHTGYQYTIDINGDGQGEYTYDVSTRTLTSFQAQVTEHSNGFDFIGINPSFLIFIGLICMLCIIAIAIRLKLHTQPSPKVFYMREKNNDLQDTSLTNPSEQETDPVHQQDDAEFIEELRQYLEQRTKGQ